MSKLTSSTRISPQVREFSRLGRRRFLGGLASAGVVPLLGGWPVRAAEANARLQHACIGVGGMMGLNDVQNFLQHPRVQVVALCDVDEDHLKKAAELVPGARRYRDWRELLAAEGDRVDSVNVTVPDHMHFPIAISAVRRGKHVYCQKPMCHDVAEVRALTEAAAKAGVVTQLGTQMASTVGERAAVQLLQQGAVGKVRHVYLCSNRPGAVKDYRLEGPRPAQGEAVPASLAWDLWLGNAPERPFAAGIYHPVKWRAWLDFGTGWSGDIGCHVFDAVWKGLGLQAPKSVIAEVQASWQASAARRADTWPQGDHITWVFPGNALTEKAELVVEWFDGEYYPPREIRELYSLEDYPPESAMVVGTEGAMLIALGTSPILLPEEKFAGVKKPKFEARNHYHHFADACLGGPATECGFARSGPMAEAILLGTVAIRAPGERLEWDAKGMRFPGKPEAERFLRRNYRSSWAV